jgi:hypothetical protein
MTEAIDYLEIEDGSYQEGSWNACVKELVQAARYLQTQLTSPEEISEYMPNVLVLQQRLQHFQYLGETNRAYFNEVFEALAAEPAADDARVFIVFELVNVKGGVVVFSPPVATFHYHRKAVRWVREKALPGKQYVIQEVFKT